MPGFGSKSLSVCMQEHYTLHQEKKEVQHNQQINKRKHFALPRTHQAISIKFLTNSMESSTLARGQIHTDTSIL